MQYLGNSLRYSPKQSLPLELMGALQLRRMSAARDPQLAVACRGSANTDFHMALVERPTSPFTWANLTPVETLSGEQDESCFRRRGAAEELGTWEPEVQQVVIFVASRSGIA